MDPGQEMAGAHDFPHPTFLHCGHGSAQVGTERRPVSTNAALTQPRAPVNQYQYGLPLTLCPRTMHLTRSWLPGGSRSTAAECVVGAARTSTGVRETMVPRTGPPCPWPSAYVGGAAAAKPPAAVTVSVAPVSMATARVRRTVWVRMDRPPSPRVSPRSAPDLP